MVIFMLIEWRVVRDFMNAYSYILENYIDYHAIPPRNIAEVDIEFIDKNKQLLLDFSEIKEKEKIEELIDALKESFKTFSNAIEKGDPVIKELITSYLEYLAERREEVEVNPFSLANYMIVPVLLGRRSRAKGYLYKPSILEEENLGDRIDVDYEEFDEIMKTILSSIAKFKVTVNGELLIEFNNTQILFNYSDGRRLLRKLEEYNLLVELVKRHIEHKLAELKDKVKIRITGVDSISMRIELKGSIRDVVSSQSIPGELNFTATIHYNLYDEKISALVRVYTSKAFASRTLANIDADEEIPIEAILSLISELAQKYTKICEEAKSVIEKLEESGFKVTRTIGALMTDLFSTACNADFAFTASNNMIEMLVSKNNEKLNVGVVIHFIDQIGTRKLARLLEERLKEYGHITNNGHYVDLVYFSLEGGVDIDIKDLPRIVNVIMSSIEDTVKWMRKLEDGRRGGEELSDEEAIAVYLLSKITHIDLELLTRAKPDYVEARVIGILRRKGVGDEDLDDEHPDYLDVIHALLRTGLVKINDSVLVNGEDLKKIVLRLNPALATEENLDEVVRESKGKLEYFAIFV